jgi:hypothetical protein
MPLESVCQLKACSRWTADLSPFRLRLLSHDAILLPDLEDPSAAVLACSAPEIQRSMYTAQQAH